jgi:hypothetical protein
MSLPTMSLRAAPEHHALIRDVARVLRDRPEMAEDLRAALQRAAEPAPTDDTVQDLLRRMTTIEDTVQALAMRVVGLENVHTEPAAETRLPLDGI